VTAAGWQAGMQARLVEHDPGTRRPVPGGKVMAATVTSVDGGRGRATATESGHGKSHGQPLGPIPFDLDGWIGAAGWPVTYAWRLVPGTNPEPRDRTRQPAAARPDQQDADTTGALP
jgi:hypothetical protein